jgi:Domain of unknown function (DUF4268)
MQEPSQIKPIIGNKKIEDAAIQFVIQEERRLGRDAKDTRYRGAPADVESSGRIIEVKAVGGMLRGYGLLLEPGQVEQGRTNPNFYVYIVENVAQGDTAKFELRVLAGDQMRRLFGRAREHRYFEVPVPVGEYKTLPYLSLPAPLLTPIVGPSEEGRGVGETRREPTENSSRRFRFWDALLKLAKTKTKLHANISPANESWIAASAGKSGVTFNYTLRKHDASVELYIYRQDAIDETKAIFDKLAAQRTAIEMSFGAPLDWQRRDGKAGSRIEKRLNLGGYLDEAKWPEVHLALADTMARLEQAMKPHIVQLQL